MVKYKACFRLKDDLYGTLQTKKLDNKKWFFLKQKKYSFSKTIFLKNLFKNILNLKKKIKIFY